MSSKLIPKNNENNEIAFNPHLRRTNEKRVIMRPNINTLEAELTKKEMKEKETPTPSSPLGTFLHNRKK